MLLLLSFQMRRKINDAFRRKHHHQKTDDDRISVTSEGSDSEVNEQGECPVVNFVAMSGMFYHSLEDGCENLSYYELACLMFGR